jgi:hypothetical protein
MNREIRKRDQQSDKASSRKPYATPRLVNFGPVGALTQAGTVSTTEVMGTGQGMDMA